ncbi:MAG: hypothetical protein LBD50_03420 [Rickettsiales bacterium]|jgi:hypothetical protein|nr:hypothetical protein [Rickettsiales bacterium]
MNAVKKPFKLFVGISALILAAVVFLFLNKSADLENGNMKHWAASSIDRRTAAVKILTGSEEHTELMTLCLNKISSLPDSADMPVKDAASLCFMGIQLKDNI